MKKFNKDIVISSTQYYYTIKLNQKGNAKRKRKKNCYVIRKIGVGLKQ